MIDVYCPLMISVYCPLMLIVMLVPPLIHKMPEIGFSLVSSFELIFIISVHLIRLAEGPL